MDKIMLGHGSGGTLMHALIDSVFMKKFTASALHEKKDSAILTMGGKRMAFTTDAYVVNPVFFPGGDIGSLAVHGTVNDLAVCGARPLYISLAFIIEEGFSRKALEKIAASAAAAAKAAGVGIVTGDTKVVEKGACDTVFITASGVGEIYYDGLSAGRIRPGDEIIVSGPIGDHAISVLSKREGIEFKTAVRSDSAPLGALIRKALGASHHVKFMRDPTRGGLATTLCEVVSGGRYGISIDEARIPVREGVRQACELLGFDPLYLACEGRVAIIVAARDAAKVLRAVRHDRLGKSAAVIGTVTAEHKGRVVLTTVSGGRRAVEMLSGEQLPRIC